MSVSAELGHVRDELSKIVHALASGAEPLHGRLERQYRALKMLRPHDFPDEFRLHYEKIMSHLATEEAREDEGRLIATLVGMSDKTGQKIASSIVSLYQNIERKLLTE